MNTNDAADAIDQECERARELAGQGRIVEAERAFQRVLGVRPEHVEALDFLGFQALLRGEAAVAVEMLNRAAHAAPDDDSVVAHLALAYKAAGRLDSARYLLERVLRNRPDAFTARLHLGIVVELEQHRRRAFSLYLRAIRDAQSHGRWISDDTTPELLRAAVKHAIRFVADERRRVLGAAIDDSAPAAANLARVRGALALHLGEASATEADRRPLAPFLHVPGLPDAPFAPRASLPWLDALEASADAIRAEALALIADDGSARAAADIEPGSDPRAALWRAIALMRRGERIEDACARCPETVALLDRLPLFRVAGESPECCFALLPPGADRTMAAGASNACLVVQLTLEAEGDCGIRIGDTTVAWQRGRALAFDDTRASQQWNRSDAPVVALLFNIWNPHLDADERDALGRLIPAITHLQRSGQDGP